MALSTATITFDIADMLGADFDARRTKAWTTTNVDNDTVIDTGANKIRLGDGKATVADDGTGSFAVWTPGSGANPASWQTYFHFDYAKAGGRERTVRTFGPFTLSGSADLADLEAEQAIPPTYLSEVTGALGSYLSDAADARDASAGYANAAAASAALAEDISNIDTPDSLVKTLVANPASQTAAALSASTAERQALDAPTMQRVSRVEVTATDPRLTEQFGGYLWGVIGSTGDIYRSTDGVSWTLYCNSWPGVGEEGFIARIIPTSDGEVIAMSGHELRKSSGWANGNAATWSASKVTPNASCIFNGFGFDGNGTKFIVVQYNSNPDFWGESRYAHISTDSGATWTQVYDSLGRYGAAANNASHLHLACYDPWGDVFYVGEGHGPAGGVYYSSNNGSTWGGPLNVSDTDTNAPTVMLATDTGMVMGSDNGDNGLFGMLRKPSPADQVIVRTWAFQSGKEGLVTFAQRALRHPQTGMVFVSFRAEFDSVNVVLAAGTPASGGLVYELPDLPVIGGADRFAAMGLVDNDNLMVYGEVQQIPHHFFGSLTKPGAGAAVLDESNAVGGRTAGKASAYASGRAQAEYVQATAAGQTAKAGASGATAFGYGANASGSSSVSVGQASAAAEGAVATGASAAAGNGGTAVGYDADSGANGAAVGAGAVATGAGTAIGAGAKSSPTSAAVGHNADAAAASAFAAGDGAIALGNSAAVGKTAYASDGGVAYGQNASARAGGAALGFGATVAAGHTNSVALGANTTTTGADQVMAGNKDVEITSSGRGVVLRSPNGARWRLSVSDAGVITAQGL